MDRKIDLEDSQVLLAKSILMDELGGAEANLLMDNIEPSLKLTPQKALEVYRSDYRARLTEVLGENYEAFWSVVGDEEFFKISLEFISKNTSTSYDLGDYGKNFPEFIKDHSLSDEFPFLFELCCFERAFLNLFHQAPEIGLDKEKIESFSDLPNAKFSFIGPIHFQSSSYSIYKIWESKDESSCQRSEDFDWKTPENIILFNTIEGLKVKHLSKAQFELFRFLEEGSNLTKALEQVSQLEIELNENDVSGFFQFISSSGILKNLSL